MHFLASLHGAIAGVVICLILFADEAGLPIPIAPNEVLLVLAGVLIQTNAFRAWWFYPVAALVMVAGMLAGYAWAYAVGQRGLEDLVGRVGAGPVYARAVERLKSAGPVTIGVARLIPGIRPWVTLICGATGYDLRRFLLGALPALLLWEIVWLTLGVIIGVPAQYFLGRFERLAIRGIILLAIGITGYLGFRRVRAEGLLALHRRGFQLPISLLITGGTAVSMLAGVLALGRALGHFRGQGWIDLLLILILLTADAVLVLVQRRRE